MRTNENKELFNAIIKGIQEVKGVNTLSLDLKNIEAAICEYFIVCSGTSNTHVDSIRNSIVYFVKKFLEEKPWNIESDKNSEWVLIDFSDIVVHIFQEKSRKFYKLEEFWGDANIVIH